MRKFFDIARARRGNEEGFSLTELVITVVIIGILAAIAVPIYTNQQAAAMKAQVDSDLMNTVSNLSQWQQHQDGYNAIPDTTTFNNKIRHRSDTSTTISITSQDWGDPNLRQFCVSASKSIAGSTYRLYYQTYTKVKAEGTCPAFVQPNQENYG